ncbi:type 4a pilus biogenesis protein PilO [Candidatus Daviesbacteria bacterium]|nr:type 4a pilus biogenesis protein PilO [Candidatus Daviesbacteria bacterium]
MKKNSFLYSSYFSYVKPVTRLPIVRNYGPTIFTLLVTAIFIIFAIKPTVETILVLQKKLADSNEVLQKVTQKANNLSQGKKNYENLDQDIKDRISEAIPDTVSLQSVTQTLEQTAKIHEASISALQIQPLTIDIKNEAKVGSLSEISFTFNVEGTYQKLFALLQELKTSSRLISVDNLSLSKASEGSGLIMSLSGKAYFLK